MRLLPDESVPRRLRRYLPGHEVKTVVEMGWGGVQNGALLALAGQGFDAFITVDKNLPYQQNLTMLPVSVVVLRAVSNDLPELISLIPELLAIIPQLKPGSCVQVGV